MKNVALYLALIALCSAGCSVDPLEENLRPDTQPSSVTRNGTVPLDEALDELQSLLEDIERHTRAEGVVDFNRAIRDIAVCGGAAATRNGDTPLPDTLAYVVNFTDNKGFAVLGAQRSLEPVYALTEAGSFDPEKLNDAIAQVYASRKGVASKISEPRSDNNDSFIRENYIYELLGSALAAERRIGSADTVSRTYGPWQTTATVGPLVEVKWDQIYPFNMAMPVFSNYEDDMLHGRYYVGCGIIAAAQMMTCTRRPIYAPAYNNFYSWTSLKSISNYTNANLFFCTYDHDHVDANTHTYMEQLADVLYYLSTCFNATYNPDGTSVSIIDVETGLKQLDPSYYANTDISVFSTLTQGLLDDIYNSLENNKPLYITGYSSSGEVGHAWVLDGYLVRKRNVTCQYQMAPGWPLQTLTRTEYGRLLHFNWGWRGSHDGYYAIGVFNSFQREMKDPIIDTRTNYDLGHEIIFY